MRLVLHFVSGDGFTYSCDVNMPFEYESAEQAILDFERDIKAARELQVAYFVFAGHQLDVSTFYAHNYAEGETWRDAKLYLPEIWTIDEWFQHESRS